MAKQTVTTKVKPPAARPAPLTNDALPAYLRNFRGPTGMEGIDSEDVTIPRLKIGQAMSDEVKDGRVQEGALFLNVTGEPVWSPGEPPLKAVIVALGKEYILWRPRDDGGGILARAKPVVQRGTRRYQWDKPNQAFTVKVDGKIKATWKTGTYVDQDGLGAWGSEIPGEKDSGPAATAHHNYVIVLPEKGNIVAAISMARSGVKKAKDLNAAIKMRGNVPLHASRWLIETTDDQNASGQKYKNWRIKPAGFITDPEEFATYDQLAKGFQQLSYNIDLSDKDADERGQRGETDDDM